MMKNFQSMEKQLVESGKADKIKAIADSADGQRLAGKLDAKKVEQAAKAEMRRRCGGSFWKYWAPARESVWPSSCKKP